MSLQNQITKSPSQLLKKKIKEFLKTNCQSFLVDLLKSGQKTLNEVKKVMKPPKSFSSTGKSNHLKQKSL